MLELTAGDGGVVAVRPADLQIDKQNLMVRVCVMSLDRARDSVWIFRDLTGFAYALLWNIPAAEISCGTCG